MSSSLSGDLADSHLTGDNSKVLATDTQKNTVYALSSDLGPVEPEVLALELARHFVAQPEGDQAGAAEDRGVPAGSRWGRAGHSFARRGGLIRGTRVVHDAEGGDERGAPGWTG